MALRLIVTMTAAPGKAAELAQAYRSRCAEIAKEPGCEQFEVFQSVVIPEKLVILERWRDQQDNPGATYEATRAIEQIRFKAGFKDRLLPKLERWLDRHMPA